MARKVTFISLLLVLAIFGGFVLTRAAEPMPTYCGDGIIQSPNSDGINEQCEIGISGADLCTNECGQKLLGWGWSSNFGWLSLNRANCSYPLESASTFNCSDYDYYVQVDVDNNLKGYAWSSNLGWICFGSACSATPGAVPSGGWQATVEPAGDNPQVNGWAKAIALGDAGWFSLNCRNDNSCAVSNYQTLLGGEFFYENGTEKISNSTLIGFAWNNDTQAVGLGWLQFSPGDVEPWIQTKLGDIYSRGGLKGSRPLGTFNATYRILANGSVEFVSSKGSNSLWVDPNYGLIDFPTPQTRYSNILGQLDLDGLLCSRGQNMPCTNKYGHRVFDLADMIDGGEWSTIVSQAGQPLGEKIYYYNGDLSLTDDIIFNNGSGFTSGAGTIIVNGNLTIGGDIVYNQTGDPGKFRNLASVAWIIKGDLIIEPQVENLSGAFVVLGNGNQCPDSISQPSNNCGRFNSGVSSNFLKISGLVIARQFNLQRTAMSPLQGSELIIYDGRLLANIPPGLVNFAQALPIWRQGVFSL